MNFPFRRAFCAICAVAVLGLSGCSAALRRGVAGLLGADETYEKEPPQNYNVTDDQSLYSDGDPDIITMYLTVGRGPESEGTDHTWEEINSHPLSYYSELGVEPYMCEALLQIGDEEGPLSGELGHGEVTPNATVRLRGAGASEQPQKSYRIDIKKGKGSWNGQKVVVLNKHVADPLRFKNKLAYDLMAQIPEMFSARTQFVRLYVKDASEGGDGLFRDYGLYTAVEQVNKRYFKNRGLDSGGSIYKAGTFDWRRHEDAIMPATSPYYNEAEFEKLLEVKGDVDHTKLIRLLESINDEDKPIWETVNENFDRGNLFYWLAFHILLGDRDAESSNYYLYSPQGIDRWYIISWDNDGILSEGYRKLRNENYDPAWNHGIFTFVSSSLYERMLKDEKCRAELDSAVEDLMTNYLTDEAVNSKAEKYSRLIKEYVYSLPDSANQRVSKTNYDILTDALTDEIERNYDAYKRSLNEPWPFHILCPEADGGTLTLRWESSYIYSGEVHYSAELSDSPDFGSIIAEEGFLSETQLKTDMLPEGQYFLRVTAFNGSGYSQSAYEYYLTETDRTALGTVCFYILSDGTVRLNEYYEE